MADMIFTAPLALPPIGFVGNPLDRQDLARRDPALLAQFRAHPAARWLVCDGLNPLTQSDSQGQLALLWLPRIAVPEGPEIFLGLHHGAPRFAISAPNPDVPGAALSDLFQAVSHLSAEEAAICAQARSLLDWHARHGFCAQCGAPTDMSKAGYGRNCTSCNAEHFPRVDPVVIMLATHGDQALIARQPRFPPKMYSALAGFLEPGETLEEAVARELYEEAGIHVGRVRYVASQPWPFPSSLMLGAFAESISTDIHIDEDELEEAFWISRPDLRRALQGEGDIRVPPHTAIAHALLSIWAKL